MTKPETVAAWFAAVEPEWVQITQELRSVIEKEGPGLSCKLAWGFPCWSGKERVFSIATHKNHCNLQLWYGAELYADFPNRIDGTGKALRHVKIKTLNDIDADLRALIRTAIRLDETHPMRVN